MSDHKNIDYLSGLPPELLEDIFNQVQLSKTHRLAPLSKSLLPFVQQPLFETLCVKTYEAFEFLCQAVVARPELGSYIKIPHVHVAMVDPENQTKNPPKEVEDPRFPSNKLIKRLFLSLVKVRSLVLTGSTRVASLVLDPVVAASSLPQLRSLYLASTFNNFRDPFHPCHYQSLQFYSELRQFKLSIFRSSKSIHAYPKTQVEPFSFRTEIVDVSLSGPLGSSLVSVHHLLTSFGSAPLLSLHDTSKESQMDEILDNICDPEYLDYLHLKRFASDGGPPDDGWFHKLERFENLTFLALEGICSSVTTDFYSSLRTLEQLGHLTFGEEAQVSLFKLTKLITGPEKLNSLHCISFDNVFGRVGTFLEEEGIPYWDDELGWTAYPDWVLPDWNRGFTEDELMMFVAEAKKEGIHVEGTALEAIGVFFDFEDELVRIALWEEDEAAECCGIDEGEDYESE
ncbi:hypothetical protein JCM5350_001260 [Sporobolomyces pararoseus]